MNSCRRLGWLGLCLLLTGCAQVGPPLPPSLELPKPPTDLHATRKGNTVTLRWTEPTLTTDRQSVRYLGPTSICRSTEDEIKECVPVGTVAAPSQPPSKSDKPVMEAFTDDVPTSVLQENPRGEITYVVEVFNRDGRSAGFSNRARITAVATFPPPQDLSAELSGDGVTLTWTGTIETPTGSDVKHRYRIYRLEQGTDKDFVAGEVPADNTGPARFLDSGFAWEKTYQYWVVPVSVVTENGAEVSVEGDDSNRVTITAHDVFPPAVPSSLQAVASGEGQKLFIDLIWAPVTTADLAGYNVYRREDDGTVMKLNSNLVTSPAYRDAEVSPGKTYVYSVSSVDVRGNESAKSEEATETLP